MILTYFSVFSFWAPKKVNKLYFDTKTKVKLQKLRFKLFWGHFRAWNKKEEDLDFDLENEFRCAKEVFVWKGGFDVEEVRWRQPSSQPSQPTKKQVETFCASLLFKSKTVIMTFKKKATHNSPNIYFRKLDLASKKYCKAYFCPEIW